MTVSLDPCHLAELEASDISPEVAEARGYQSITNPRALPDLFRREQRRPGLLMPIRDVTGEIATYQLKPDEPRIDGTTQKPVKYETAAHGRTCIDVPAAVAPHLRNVDIPLWITEGVKKVDSALSHGMPCVVGLQGVWNWKSRGSALPDFDEIDLRGRRVVIAYDSDVMVKASPRAAVEALARYLTMQRAEVEYLIMPDLPDGAKCGLDDWFAAGGTYLDLQNMTTATLPGSVMDWEPPIPLDPTTGPPFPLEALPDSEAVPLRSLVAAIAAQTQAPADVAASCALGIIGAAMRGRYVVQPRKDWQEATHLQALQVLASGGGKSPTYKVLVKALYTWDANQRTAWEEEHKTWKQEHELRSLMVEKARAKAKSQKGTSDDEKRWQGYLQGLRDWEEREPKLRRIVASNITAEALERRIYEQGGAMAVVSAEGGFLNNITGNYSDAPKLEVLLYGYTGEGYERDRVTDDEQWRVARSCVAVSLAIQPSVLVDMGKVPGFQRRGVAARFLLTCPAETPWPDLDPPDIPDRLLTWWHDRILEIANGTDGTAADPVAIPLAPEAFAALQAERAWWREARARGAFATMPEWGKKYAGNVLRVAGTLHVLEHPEPVKTPITPGTMGRAVTIMRNAIDHARVAHGIMNGTASQELALELLGVLETMEGDTAGDITSAGVYDRVRGRLAFQHTSAVIRALRTLEEHRYIRLERRPGPGPETYRVIFSPLRSGAKMRSSGETSPSESPAAADTGVISHLRTRSGPDEKTHNLQPTGTDGWEDF